MPATPTARPVARGERALAPVLQRADDHGRDRRHQRDPLGQHLARAQREDHHRDRDRAAADAEQPGQEAAVEPEREQQQDRGQRRARASRCPRRSRTGSPAAGRTRRLTTANAIRRPRSEMRALTRAPSTAPAEAADDEDGARLGLEGAAGRDRVGDGGDDGDRQDRHQRGPRRRVAVEAGRPDQPGDDDDPAADAEQPGQQARPPPRRAASRRVTPRRARPAAARRPRRSCGVVTLKFSGVDSTTRTRAPVALDQPGVVGRRRRARRRRRRARARAPRAGTPAASGSPTAACGRASRSRARSSPASLTVSVIGAAAIAASASSSAASASRKCAGVTSGRAASWTTTCGSARAARSALRTDAERVAPPATPTQPGGAEPPGGSATTISSIPAARSASTLHSSIGRPARTTNALGRSAPRRSPLPAATRRATATISQRLARRWPASPRRSAGGGRRGAPRPAPRPSRARTSARTRGSSSRG